MVGFSSQVGAEDGREVKKVRQEHSYLAGTIMGYFVFTGLSV